MTKLDEMLFQAWKSGSEEARQKAWLLLWQTLDAMAVRFCRRLGLDDSAAEEWATQAFCKTIEEIDQKIRLGQVKWENEVSFVAYVRNCLIFRCRDGCRVFWRTSAHTVSLEDEEGASLLDALGFRGASPEEDVLAAENMRATIRLVAAAWEVCRRQKALADLLKGMKRYLRQCLAEATPPEVDADALTFDQLLDAAVMENLEVNKTEMYQFLMDSLRISRNTLDLRMKRVHDILRKLCASEFD
jgi:hypothetical protein